MGPTRGRGEGTCFSLRRERRRRGGEAASAGAIAAYLPLTPVLSAYPYPSLLRGSAAATYAGVGRADELPPGWQQRGEGLGAAWVHDREPAVPAQGASEGPWEQADEEEEEQPPSVLSSSGSSPDVSVGAVEPEDMAGGPGDDGDEGGWGAWAPGPMHAQEDGYEAQHVPSPREGDPSTVRRATGDGSGPAPAHRADEALDSSLGADFLRLFAR